MMKIKRFRIKNYKSIIDCGDCYLSEGITVLAGKNESGKTSVLQALEDFDTDKDIRNEAKPIYNRDAKPEISIAFTIDKDAINSIVKEVGDEGAFSSDIDIELIKKFPNIYTFGDSSPNDITNKSQIGILKFKIIDLTDKINKISSSVPQLGLGVFSFKFENIAKEKASFILYKSKIDQKIGQVDGKDIGPLAPMLIDIVSTIDSLEAIEAKTEKTIKILKDKHIPNFILFSSFEDIFPNKIPTRRIRQKPMD